MRSIIQMVFRNTLNAIVASFAAIASGFNALFMEIEPIIGTLAAVVGILAGYATYRAQMEKAKTERLEQVRLEGYIEAANESHHFEAKIKSNDDE